MQPRKSVDPSQTNYRMFHPGDIIKIQNPHDHEVIWQVADEFDKPVIYKVAAHGQAQLPGGNIAALGLKEIVDEMIMNSPDFAQLWELNVRAKYESKVILFFKEAAQTKATKESSGEVDLTVSDDHVEDVEDEAEPEVEEEFPGLKAEPVKAEKPPEDPAIRARVNAIAQGAKGTKDQVLETVVVE